MCLVVAFCLSLIYTLGEVWVVCGLYLPFTGCFKCWVWVGYVGSLQLCSFPGMGSGLVNLLLVLVGCRFGFFWVLFQLSLDVWAGFGLVFGFDFSCIIGLVWF